MLEGGEKLRVDAQPLPGFGKDGRGYYLVQPASRAPIEWCGVPSNARSSASVRFMQQ